MVADERVVAIFTQYARNIGALVGQAFVQRVVGMLTTMVLARVLGATSFGAYGVVTSTATSAYGIVRFGVDAAIHVTTAERSSDEAFRVQVAEIFGAGLLLLLIGGILAGLGCVVFAELIATSVYGKRELIGWVRAAGLLAFLNCVCQFFYAALAGMHRFAAYARVMIATSLGSLIAVSCGALFWGLTGAVIAMLMMQVILSASLFRASKQSMRKAAIDIRMSNFVATSSRLLRFGFPFYSAGLVVIPAVYFLQGLVVKVSNLESLGFLRAIMAVSTLVSFVPVSAAAAMISMLAQAKAQEDRELPAVIIRNIKFVFVFAIITASVVNLHMPWLVAILFGQSYVSTTKLAGIMVVTAVLTSTTGAVGNVLFSIKRVKLLFLITTIQASCFWVIGILLIPRFGLTGYVVSEFVSHVSIIVCFAVPITRWSRRQGASIRWAFRSLVLVSLLMVYTVRFVRSDGTALSYLVGAIVVVVIVVSTYAFVLDSTDRSLVMDVMRPRQR